MINGFVDAVTHTCVRGWCADSENPASKQKLFIMLGEIQLGICIADNARADLVSFGDNGKFGFSYQFDYVADIQSVCVKTIDGVTLPVINVINGEKMQMSDSIISADMNQHLKGEVDAVGNGYVEGWIHISNGQPIDQSKINLIIKINDQEKISDLALNIVEKDEKNNILKLKFRIIMFGFSEQMLLSTGFECELSYAETKIKLDLSPSIIMALNYNKLKEKDRSKFNRLIISNLYLEKDNFNYKTTSDLCEYLYLYGSMRLQAKQFVNFINSEYIFPYLKISLFYKFIYDCGINLYNKSLNINNDTIISVLHDRVESMHFMSLINFSKYALSELTTDNINYVVAAMQKDEDYLLLIWALYYMQIVGPRRIVIFDNGSSSSRTKAILKCLETCGVKIIYKFSSRSDFNDKGNIIINETRRQFESCVNIIPVDIDEFMVALTDSPFSCNPCDVASALNEELASLSITSPIIKISTSYTNIPSTRKIYYCEHWRTLLHYTYVGYLDKGLHLAVLNGLSQVSKKIGYMHFHNRFYDKMRSNAEIKLKCYVDITNPEALSDYHGPGSHVSHVIQNGESGYMSMLQKYNRNTKVNIEDKWQQCRLPWPL